MSNYSESQPIIDTVKALHNPQLMPIIDGVSVILRPNGFTVESIKKHLDEYAERPDRKTGTAELFSLASFIDHVNRTKEGHSVVFADSDRAAPKLLAVYNYDHASDFNGEAPDPEVGSPEFRDHRAVYNFPLSDEWKAWLGSNGKEMTQAAFAQFIEDRIVDVEEPGNVSADVKELLRKIDCEMCGAARLAELSRSLEVRVGLEYSAAQRVQSGESSLVWKERHTDEKGEPLKVPGAFLIAIPLWRGGDLWMIPVRLRYRPLGNQVLWYYQLFRTERIFEMAIKRACEMVATQTDLQVFEGVPEVCSSDDDD